MVLELVLLTDSEFERPTQWTRTNHRVTLTFTPSRSESGRSQFPSLRRCKRGACTSTSTSPCTPTLPPSPPTPPPTGCNGECGVAGSPLGYYSYCDQSLWDATGDCVCPGTLDPNCPDDSLTDAWGRCRGELQDCSAAVDYTWCNGGTCGDPTVCTNTVMFCDSCKRQVCSPPPKKRI